LKLVAMETDSFFCQLLKQLPETLFQLLGLPGERARAYRFDSVEIKKSFRIDGLFIPARPELPLYFVEVQAQASAKFYANLFAKVFWFLEENDPAQEWIAVPIFANRSVEQKNQAPYEDLLRSPRVKRIYLDELVLPPDPPVGLSLLQLVTASDEQAKPIVTRIADRAEAEFSDSEIGSAMLKLLEELLMRRHPQLTGDEVRTMFQLTELSKTRAGQEIREEGRQEGRQEGREEGREEGRQEGVTLATQEFARKCLAKGLSIEETAELTGLSVTRVRRLSKKAGK
jgi:predicted transposase/invertase (TIGR01784 family)